MSLPKGGGAIRGIGEKFSMNAATGTGALAIPIATSPGRAGFQPSLQLAYDSGAGNGPFGLGWRLSAPAITRKTDRGLPRYADAEASDVFVLSGAEDLVPVRVPDGDGTRIDVIERDEHRVQRYRPRVEGLFARIERWTNRATGDAHWRVITRDNVLSIYGQSAEARVADPADPRRVFSWLLEETRDDRGNVLCYRYKGEDGAGVQLGQASEASRFDAQSGSRHFLATAQRYLKRIQYGNRVPVGRDQSAPTSDDDWLFEVVIDYGEHDEATPTPDEARTWPVRPDPFSSYRAAFEVRTYRLCRRVLMFHRFAELGPTPYLVRSTDFTYEESHVRSQDGAFDGGPATTYLTSVTHAGYLRDAATDRYERATLPPLDLGYARPVVHDTLRAVDRESLAGIPGGVDGATALWVDLDGEGIPGVLIPTERAWYYKANLGEGHLAPPSLERSLPAPAQLRGGAQQLTDLGGEGNLDLVQYARPLSGYFERTPEHRWRPFVPLHEVPNLDWNDPNLRFLDLDGDGFPDILITEHQAFVWYRSKEKDGFEPARRVWHGTDEQEGPAIVFADGTETIHLADMSGDGLVDIVRIRNSEVCYWPNLGHGRFGRKVTLDGSPRFDASDHFDPRRLRLADIDGSGTTDIVYLGRDGVRIYFNHTGNALSAPLRLASVPAVDSLASLSVVDLLGQGTACLVWSSSAPGRATRPLAYVDLMGGKKPHLLESVVNNLGAETRIAYAPSTKFYLQDKAEGRPWLTRLPFPVHVVERTESYDHVARSRLVTRFRYRHGYFDGHEREFRGFACVEQWDAESFGGERGRGLFPDLPYDVDPADPDLNLPPVRMVTWFHTGAWLEREHLERELAKEYYQGDLDAPRLPDTVLPRGLSVQEEREAARALRGSILRQEIYGEDGLPESSHPYSVSEKNYEVRVLQRAGAEAHGVFFVHAREAVTLHYERKPRDPRLLHDLVLDVDDFGTVLRAVALAYPRRIPEYPEQARLWATMTEREVVNRTGEPDWYRIGGPVEETTSELTGLIAPSSGVLSSASIRDTIASSVELSFEEAPTPAVPERRVIARKRATYYRDDLSGPLPRGVLDSRALPFESYQLALTPGLVAQVFGPRVDAGILARDGGFVDQDGLWWAPSGRAEFDPERFYLPVASIDPFGNRQQMRYDAYALLPLESEDALGNRVTIGLRDASDAITQNGNDYRVLAPTLVTDPNRNRTAVALDALGMVVATAVMGKAGAGEGDTLSDPTTRLEYDLHRWRTTGGRQPSFVRILSREQHGPGNSRWQEAYAYPDGFGREVMAKVQAAPGPAPVLDAEGRVVRNPDGTIRFEHTDTRWIGSGRSVFDNKGNVVKKYEPFFSSTFEYEDERDLTEWGVTPVLRYDPAGRLVRSDLPDGTHTKVVFDAWRQETWDPNDTSPGTRWLARMQAGTAAEQRAADLTLEHAATPSVIHQDALGRSFLAVADNGPRGLLESRVELDVTGHARQTTDARGIVIQTQTFDLLGRGLYGRSSDAGEARALTDVLNMPVRRWSARGHQHRRQYDALRRATHFYVRGDDGVERLVERTVYGEAALAPEARNLRGQPVRIFDGAGVVLSTAFDFKGNLLESTRRLAVEYKDLVEWSTLADLTAVADVDAAAQPLLADAAGSFTTRIEYDSLNRATSRTTPDGSEAVPTYNEANLLDHLAVRVRGAATPNVVIDHVDYNARGQRERVEHGNGSVTYYTYDPTTFHLTSLRTHRTSDGALLQDLGYTYDALGNIVQISDAVSLANPAVSATGLYTYDATYQLVEAEGREHPGQQPTDADRDILRLNHPEDMQALRRYRESYTYDAAGNLLAMAHVPLGSGPPGWTRTYAYAADSNCLLATSAPGDPSGTRSLQYSHDAHGNMTSMPHLADMRWDRVDRLQFADRGGGGKVWFVYDAAGQRVRKVYEHGGFAEERVYLGAYELYRKRGLSSGAVALERETLRVEDSAGAVTLFETKTIDTSIPAHVPSTRSRLQVANHLGSSCLEVDASAQVITYEEYFPYGGSAFRAGASASEVSAKRYRYAGKERDTETGLDQVGVRYYASWLGRWTSADPAGTVDGFNLFAYCRGNPVTFRDPKGTERSLADVNRSLDTSGDRNISLQELTNLSGAGWTFDEWAAQMTSHSRGGYSVDKNVQQLIDHVTLVDFSEFRRAADTGDTTLRMGSDGLQYTHREARAAGERRLKRYSDPMRVAATAVVAAAVVFPEAAAVAGSLKTGLDTGQAITGESLSGDDLSDQERGEKFKGAVLGWVGIWAVGYSSAAGAAESRVTRESAGGTNPWTSPEALQQVTGRTAQQRNAAINAVLKEDLANVRMTHQPQYSPYARTGVASRGEGTQIGKNVFSSRKDLVETIVHEELHHRWWARGIPSPHHSPDTYIPDELFYQIIARFMRRKGF